jgi:protein TonB
MKRLVLLTLLLGCGGEPQADIARGDDAAPPEYEPPVALNAGGPVAYPLDMFEQRLEGTVRLRLYLLDDGTVVTDSTRIEEASGHAQLDSAALAAVEDMTFAPARRMGVPVETGFIQPVQFRHPDGESVNSGNSR